MVRAILATLAAVLLVAVLSLLIIESRAVKEEDYVLHAERMRAIETSHGDFATIAAGTRSAFEEGRPVSPAVDLAYARVAENNQLLQKQVQTLSATSPLLEQLATYDVALAQYLSDGQAFSATQNALSEALRTLQEESPAVVKELRRVNLGSQSQSVFSLAIDVIEFATGQSGSEPEGLLERIEALGSDSSIVAETNGLVDEFVAAAGTVVTEHAATEAALENIGGGRIGAKLDTLTVAILNDNRILVGRAERARLLLAICAVLLLVGAGVAMLRLQSSYRDLNSSNSELEKVNDSLEERVQDRTEELTGAYDELKESQVQLVQAEKMSSLGELVAGISHEINTPLWYLMSNSTVIQERLDAVSEFCGVADKMIASIKSGTAVKETVGRGLMDMQRMLKDGMKEDIDEAKDLVQDSIDGLEELTELAQSLKDFSRLDRAKQGEFNVNDGIDKTLLIAKNRLKNKVTIHKYYGDLPPIQCSPSQINQIFLNLITNAADAISESGEIVIKTWREQGNVCISFADTGSGIPKELLAKIRDPFFTTKEVGKGTGLGLSIVEQIVNAHHGKLNIESEPSKGTVVTVTLPVTAPAAEGDETGEFTETTAMAAAAAAAEVMDEPNSLPDLLAELEKDAASA